MGAPIIYMFLNITNPTWTPNMSKISRSFCITNLIGSSNPGCIDIARHHQDTPRITKRLFYGSPRTRQAKYVQQHITYFGDFHSMPVRS